MSKNLEMAILMADLSGYTAMTEIHGPQSAFDMVNRYMELAEKSMYGSSRLLERVGDQLVIVSPSANDLAITALQLLAYCAAESNFLQVHAGLHFGRVMEKDGSYFGSAMNITSRIAAKAKDGRILGSMEFMDQANAEGNFDFRVQGKVRLKNILNPIVLVELLPSEKSLSSDRAIDPVCLMAVDEGTNFHYTHNHVTHYFCDDSCLEVFEKDPESILARV